MNTLTNVSNFRSQPGDAPVFHTRNINNFLTIINKILRTVGGA